VLEIRGVSKAYDDVAALRGVDLDIGPGEIVGLLGPNGAGKSTLISIVAGLVKADAGTVRIGGLNVRSNLLKVRRLMGVAPQELGIYLQLSVSTNLRFFGKLAGLRGDQLTDRIETVAAALDLSHLLDCRAQELSGGEKRRLHTGTALLHGARLLLLDEPTAGVDIATRNSLLALVRELAAEGAAICYATHYLPEVEALNASVAILEAGRFIAKGTVAELTTAFNEAVVEIRLDRAVPRHIAVDGRVADDACLLRIQAHDSGAALSRAFIALGSAASRVASVEVVQPSLESAYLAITGHRFAAVRDDSSR
jgi:ABC-2 type transport system ATP-binding protein